jgi:Tol biopolymer transport system component
MTTDKAEDDGPEYSADGKWVYFCSKRSGKWDAWRMPADGAGPDDKLAEKITNGTDTQDWFPHISPDGKWLYTISYPINHPDHNYIGEDMKIKLLRLKNGVGAKDAELKTVRTFFGGQGAGNTGGWSPGSKKFAWTEYEKIPAQAK